MEQPPDQSSRSSRARERVQRRKAKRSSTESPSRRTGSMRRFAQLTPAGGSDLPPIDMRLVRYVLLGVGAVVFMVALIYAVGLFTEDPPQPDPNALWIGEDWTYETHTDEEVSAFIDQLKTNEIGAVFARVSDLNVDSTWTGRVDGVNRFAEVELNVEKFVKQIKGAAPDLELYGVVGFPVNLGEDGYRLDDENLYKVIADFSANAINQLGFDGILLDIEPVWNGDENLLALVRQVRQTIGSDALLALAVPPDWTPVDAGIPIPELIEPGTVWDHEYKQRIALLQIDLIVVQSYNSYLTRSEDYVDWMAYQVEAYAEAVTSLETDTRILMGVPTYKNVLPAHDTRVENVTTAIDGIRQGLEDAGDNAFSVQGVAIFADWDTDTQEWAQFKQFWVEG